MTAFLSDSLADQIERGELFFGFDTDFTFSEGTIKNIYTIETFSKDCSVVMDFQCRDTIFIEFLEDAAAYVGNVDSPLTNMNLASSNTILTKFGVASSVTGGTLVKSIGFIDGEAPANIPFSKDAGIILKANTKYAMKVTNLSGTELILTVSMLFRELFT